MKILYCKLELARREQDKVNLVRFGCTWRAGDTFIAATLLCLNQHQTSQPSVQYDSSVQFTVKLLFELSSAA